MSNPAVDPAPAGRWTLRDKAAQRRSPLRWATPAAMFLASNAADHSLLSRRRLRAIKGRGVLALLGSEVLLALPQRTGRASSVFCAAASPASAQHRSHLQPFAAPGCPSSAAGHRGFRSSAAAALPCAAGHRFLAHHRPCSAPPHGGSVLLRSGFLSVPAALVSPLGRRRMSHFSLATASVPVLGGVTAALRSGAQSLLQSLLLPRFSLLMHKALPNPAVNRTPNKRLLFSSTRLTRRRLLLRWASNCHV